MMRRKHYRRRLSNWRRSCSNYKGGIIIIFLVIIHCHHYCMGRI